MFLGIYLFLHWCVIVHTDLLESFVIPCISCNVSSFIFNFIYLSFSLSLSLFFFFFGVNLAKGLSILFILSKNQLLVLLIFSITFVLSHLFMF